MKWRDISTAPKDGTDIIVFRPNGDDKKGAYISKVSMDWWGKTSFYWNGCWMKSNSATQPTHWMPLPAAPSKPQPDTQTRQGDKHD